MTTSELVLLGQLLLNIALVVQHVRLKRSCDAVFSSHTNWLVHLDQRVQELEHLVQP